MFVRVVLLKNVPSLCCASFGKLCQADVLSTQLRLEGAFLFMFCLLQILITTYTHRRTVCNTVTLGNNPPRRTRGSLLRREEGKNRPVS